jgi:ABC-type branched-subunit amino acid transport system ATPase component
VSSTSTYNGSNTIDWTANSDMLLAYQNLLSFYNSSNAVRKGILTTYGNSNIAVFKKSNATENVLVIVNTRSSSQTLAVPAELQGNWVNALTTSAVSLSGNLGLTSYQYLILKK